MSTLLAVHTTDATAFKSCRVRWDFSSPLRRNLTPKRQSEAFGFGTAWHDALETYYEPSTERDITKAKRAMLSSLNAWYLRLPNPTPDDDEDFANYRQLGLGMLDHYGEWAAKEDDFEVIWVERHYEVEIPGIEVPYSFKPDGLIRDRAGRYWILEHKSADKLPDNTDYLLLDDQCGKYIWALWKAEGIHVEGVLYSMARKKLPTPLKVLKSGLLSQDKRILTTFDYAGRQIMQHFGKIPEIYLDYLENLRNKENPFFYRENVRRNARELDFIQMSVVAEAREMLDPDVAIYRNPNRFNCSSCAFVGPCIMRAEGGDVEPTLEGNYVQNRRGQ